MQGAKASSAAASFDNPMQDGFSTVVGKKTKQKLSDLRQTLSANQSNLNQAWSAHPGYREMQQCTQDEDLDAYQQIRQLKRQEKAQKAELERLECHRAAIEEEQRLKERRNQEFRLVQEKMKAQDRGRKIS